MNNRCNGIDEEGEEEGRRDGCLEKSMPSLSFKTTAACSEVQLLTQQH